MRSSTRGTASSSASATSCRGSTDRGAATRLVLGGWQANGIIQGQTGFPLTVIEPTNVSLTSQTNRPNMTCDPNEGGAAHDRAVVQHLVLPAADAGGKRRPGRQRSAQRRPRPGLQPDRPVAVQELRARAASRCSCGSRSFNVFNQERFGQPGNTLGAATFGAITAAEDGRIVQLGIKYTF